MNDLHNKEDKGETMAADDVTTVADENKCNVEAKSTTNVHIVYNSTSTIHADQCIQNPNIEDALIR